MQDKNTHVTSIDINFKNGNIDDDIIIKYNQYHILHTIDSITYYYGAYKTRTEARHKVKELKKNNWDITQSQIPTFLFHDSQNLEPKSYKIKPTREVPQVPHEITKIIGDKKYYFGEYKTRKEAEHYLAFLTQHNWKFKDNYMPLYCIESGRDEPTRLIVDVSQKTATPVDTTKKHALSKKTHEAWKKAVNKSSKNIEKNRRYVVHLRLDKKIIQLGFFKSKVDADELKINLTKHGFKVATITKTKIDIKKGITTPQTKPNYTICNDKFIIYNIIYNHIYIYGEYNTIDETKDAMEYLAENGFNTYFATDKFRIFASDINLIVLR